MGSLLGTRLGTFQSTVGTPMSIVRGPLIRPVLAVAHMQGNLEKFQFPS